jgi:transcriptional regulator with XRE-family HTH domain
MKKIAAFSGRLKEALALRGLNSAELAAKAGLSKSLINYYRTGNGEPKAETLYIVAEALNVDESWLMGFDVPQSRRGSELLRAYSELSGENQAKVLALIGELSQNPVFPSEEIEDETEDLDLAEIISAVERTKSAILDAANQEITQMALEIDELIRTQNAEVQYVRSRLEDTKKRHRKFEVLHKYFKRQTSDSLTLTFDEIEEIIGNSLPKSASENIYWTRRGRQFIGDCWVSNGYKISELDVSERRVSFYRFIAPPV